MSCLLCNNINCIGNCSINQCIAQTNPYGYVYPLNGWPPTQNTYIAMDTSLSNFLETIADKTDTEACVSFIEQQRQVCAAQIQELERIKLQHQENLEKAEKEFISKCVKYRPSITSDILIRIKGLKVFY